MKGFKLQLAGFVIASLIASSIVTFLTALVVISVGGLIPVLFFALAMAVIGYAFFQVFQSEGGGRYIYASAISTFFLSIPPLVIEKASSAISSILSVLNSQGVSVNADPLFGSMFICFNLVSIIFYARSKGFENYSYFLSYLLPLSAYAVLTII